jgi:hypothetical protein
MTVVTELMKEVAMKKENVMMKLKVLVEVVNIVAIICQEVAISVSVIEDTS